MAKSVKKRPDKQDVIRDSKGQFVKGHSGNINGRPPDEFTVWAHLKHRLSQPVNERMLTQLAVLEYGPGAEVPDKWKNGKMTWGQAIAIKCGYRAMSPDGDAMVRTILNYSDGLPVARIQAAVVGQFDHTVDLKRLPTDKLKMIREIIAEATVSENGDQEQDDEGGE